MTTVHQKFQKMLRILQLLGTFTNTWPPHPNIEKTELFLRNLYYYIAIFISAAVWIPMVLNIYNSRNDDIDALMKNVSHVAALTEAILNSILCRIKRKQLQVRILLLKKIYLEY